MSDSIAGSLSMKASAASEVSQGSHGDQAERAVVVELIKEFHANRIEPSRDMDWFAEPALPGQDCGIIDPVFGQCGYAAQSVRPT